jgi:S-adenosylmethionine synthetase
MLSQIGRPIYDPQLVDLRVRPAAGTSASALEPMAAGAVRDELARIADVREQLIAERIVPY